MAVTGSGAKEYTYESKVLHSSPFPKRAYPDGVSPRLDQAVKASSLIEQTLGTSSNQE